MTSGLLYGHPSKETNAYNFQDVSKWKDLGPTFYYKYIVIINKYLTSTYSN